MMMVVMMTIRLAFDLANGMDFLCFVRLVRVLWLRLFRRARATHRDVFASLSLVLGVHMTVIMIVGVIGPSFPSI